MEFSQETIQMLRDAAQKFAEAIKEAFREIVSRFWDLIKEKLPVIKKFIQEYKEREQRHRDNEDNRSGWLVKRDTRRTSQVISNKPKFMVRKIIG